MVWLSLSMLLASTLTLPSAKILASCLAPKRPISVGSPLVPVDPDADSSPEGRLVAAALSKSRCIVWHHIRSSSLFKRTSPTMLAVLPTAS